MAEDLEYTLDSNGVLQPSTTWPQSTASERAYVCCICLRGFRASDTVRFRGKVYGKPCGDNAEIQGIMRKEAQGRSDRPAPGEDASDAFEGEDVSGKSDIQRVFPGR